MKSKNNKKNKILVLKIISIIFLLLLVMSFVYYLVFLSSDNSLKALTIENSVIALDKENDEYDYVVGNEIENLSINAVPNDESATILISGAKLSEGENVVTLTVKAENGFKRIYTINVYRKQIKYECPEGYTLNGTSCEKLEYVKAAQEEYGCSNGGTLNKKICEVYDYEQVKINYSCPDGYSLNGSNCVKKISEEALHGYNCPSGYEYIGSTCVSHSEVSYTKDWYCADRSYILEGDKCVFPFTMKPHISNGRYVCSSSLCTLYGQTCQCKNIKMAYFKRVCPDGYTLDLEADKCVLDSTKDPLNSYYYCSEGFTLLGTSCHKEETIASTETYSCSTGYTKVNNNQCRKLKNTYEAQIEYACDDDLTLESDNNCYRVLAEEPSKTEY